MTVALQFFPSLLAMFHTPEKILSRVFEFMCCVSTGMMQQQSIVVFCDEVMLHTAQ